MKKVMLLLMVMSGLVLSGAVRISDNFNDYEDTFNNWSITEEKGDNTVLSENIISDSLVLRIESEEGEEQSAGIYFGKNEGIWFGEDVDEAYCDVSFKTGLPYYGDNVVSKYRVFRFLDATIGQYYNDPDGALTNNFYPGYYIMVSGYRVGYINKMTPLDFKIEITRSSEPRFLTYTFIAYENGTEIFREDFDGMEGWNGIELNTIVGRSSVESGEIFTDRYIEHEIRVNKVWIYPDYSTLSVNHTNKIVGYTSLEQDVYVSAKDSYTGLDGRGCAVKITTGEGTEYTGITDDDGDYNASGVSTANENDMDITISKGEYYNYSDRIYVVFNSFSISHTTEIPVINTYNNEITVYGDKNMLDVIVPIENALVELSNGDDYIYSGYSNSAGLFAVTDKTMMTKAIKVRITKDTYKTYEGNIYPYLWSNVPEAFGMNNQDHIVRKPNTDEMRMVYTTGDNIIYAKSSDFGATWELEVLGEGDKPTMIQTPDGYLSAWVENNCDLVYTLSQSPWIPIDTLNPDLYWVTEPTLGYTAVNDKSYLGYIGNNQLIGESGSYVLASMTNLDPATLTFDTVVSYLGEYDKVPMKSPVFSLIRQSDGFISNLIGFIDTSSEYVVKNWNLNDDWGKAFSINNVNQICNSPTTDYYGEVTTFAYEVINLDGTRDIWEAKMTDGVMEAPTKTNSFVGVNKNPKVKNNYLTAYVNNDDKVLSEPGYGLTYQQNVVASTEDSIFSYDVNLKETYTSKKGLFVWTEGSNGAYKLNMKQVFYKPEPVPYIASEPTDTITTVTVSPLYEYIGKKEPVEQLNTTINGLNPEMNYTIKVITSEGSPVKPQVIQIDGEVYAVVMGHANRSDTTEITLPKETYQDYSVVVSIDRKRGNPNRDAEVLVYQYETDGENVVAVSNKIKTFAPVNTTETSTNLFTSKDNAYISYTSERTGEVEIEVYNVTGSKVSTMKAKVKAGANKLMLNGINKTGVYFAVIRNGEVTETSRINIIR